MRGMILAAFCVSVPCSILFFQEIIDSLSETHRTVILILLAVHPFMKFCCVYLFVCSIIEHEMLSMKTCFCCVLCVFSLFHIDIADGDSMFVILCAVISVLNALVDTCRTKPTMHFFSQDINNLTKTQTADATAETSFSEDEQDTALDARVLKRTLK